MSLELSGDISPQKVDAPKTTKAKRTKLAYSKLPKTKRGSRFNVDENILKQAEEDSQLLDSLAEISERQLRTEREADQRDWNEGSLLNNLLEPEGMMPPFNFDSI